MIAREANAAVKEMVTKESPTLVEESLDDTLRPCFSNAQSGMGLSFTRSRSR